MTVLKKTLSLLLAVCLALGSVLSAPALADGFTDVPAGAWYAADVRAVTSLGLFRGASVTDFSPDTSMTRGMFITALGRYAGVDPKAVICVGTVTGDSVNVRESPNTSAKIVVVLMKDSAVDVLGLESGWYQVRAGGSTGYVRADLLSAPCANFTDVDYGAYYGPYVQWAYSLGIIQGVSDSLFNPGASITRGQILTILSSYARANQLSLPGDLTALLFTDPNNLDLGSAATRAQAAALLHRFVTAAGGYTGYNLFGNVVHKSAAVADSYFDDACFIGNSMVTGMKQNFSLPSADFFNLDGATAAGILAYDQFPGTLSDALARRGYGKVYLMLGSNDLSQDAAKADTFYSSICALIDMVRAKQPAAIIYLISILPVSEDLRSQNINRDSVLAFNAKLMRASLDKTVYYLDAFAAFADANGCLPASACKSDGIQLLPAQYPALKDYLKTHTA